MESKSYYLYLWQNTVVTPQGIVHRTCFGITGDLDRRQNEYEGHVGNNVVFLHVWEGPERVIRTLESKVKDTFMDHRFVGHRKFRYEWITEAIPLQQIVKYLEWEIEIIPTVTRILGAPEQ